MTGLFLFKVWAVAATLLLYFLCRIYVAYREYVSFGNFFWTYLPSTVTPGALVATLALLYFGAYGWMMSILILTCLFNLWQYRMCMVKEGI